jgi:hypothetical protein
MINISARNPPSHPDEIAIVNGTGPLVEAVISCVAEPGDAIVVPTPYYHTFSLSKHGLFLFKAKRPSSILILHGILVDVCKRTRNHILGVPLRRGSDQAAFALDFGALTAQYEHVTGHGQKVAALLFTNPHNPTGEKKNMRHGHVAWWTGGRSAFLLPSTCAVSGSKGHFSFALSGTSRHNISAQVDR